MRNFFAGLFLLLGVGCLGVAGFSAYQDRVISPQMSSASSPVLFSQVSDISSYVCEAGKKYNILMVPGSSFACPGYVRLAYCVSYDTIINSLPEFKKLAEEFGL